MILLECCVDSVESALAAKAGGADRLEICSGLPMGGLSPSPCLFRRIKETCGDLKLHVLLRPRVGDFCYSDEEFEIIRDRNTHAGGRAGCGADAGTCERGGRDVCDAAPGF